MSELSVYLGVSRLWRQTLAAKLTTKHSTERERLRTVFLRFRERAGYLANESGRLPCSHRSRPDASRCSWEIGSIMLASIHYNVLPKALYWEELYYFTTWRCLSQR